MKILLIGANGQLGTDLVKVLGQGSLVPLNQNEIDITDYSRTQSIVEPHQPDIIINTAAYHNVPLCEQNRETAFKVNAYAVENLARICQAKKIKLIHFSTDYVFDGKKTTPYNEDDTPNPLNVYAQSKLAGERFVQQMDDYYLIRTAGLYGTAGCWGKGGTNFVENILRQAKTQKTLQVADNIITNPTYTYDLALKIKELIEQNYASGIYHITNSGQCSWYEFALEIASLNKLKVKIEPKQEQALQAGVKRPLYSVLTSKKLSPLRHWKDALKDYLAERTLTTDEH
jgi:dTDP-4-dehydrorhamnose reductase